MRAQAIQRDIPGVPVLHGVSIEVAAGELLAIVGPNGAGKSTLLKVLGGSIKPRAAAPNCSAVRSLDRSPRESRGRSRWSARKISVAFRFSVLEIVLMGPRRISAPSASIARTTWRSRTPRSTLRPASSCAPPVQELSGGERKRAFLARALAQEPQDCAARRADCISRPEARCRNLRALSRALRRARHGGGRDAARSQRRRAVR